jgi:hypothetical protein
MCLTPRIASAQLSNSRAAQSTPQGAPPENADELRVELAKWYYPAEALAKEGQPAEALAKEGHPAA